MEEVMMEVEVECTIVEGKVRQSLKLIRIVGRKYKEHLQAGATILTGTAVECLRMY